MSPSRPSPKLSRGRLIQLVLRNLVSNAIKFTPKNGSIIVSAEVDFEDVQICVKDNGIGMNEETVSGLFTMEKVKSVRGTENEQGTGLGLILCKEFVDRFHGDISVESTPGKGSTFTIKLPKAIRRVEEQVA